MYQSLIISLLRVAIRPIYSVFILSSAGNRGESLSEALTKKTPHPKADDSNVVMPLRPVDRSRSGFITCYFYLYIILREEKVDSFVLNWFIDQLLIDVCRTQVPMQKGDYSPCLWFWTVMFGACVTTAGKTVSSLEETQMNSARDQYMDKINLVSQTLKIKTWEGAKAVLSQFAWEDEFDGEQELKEIWEEAVWDGNRRANRAGNGDSCSAQAFW